MDECVRDRGGGRVREQHTGAAETLLSRGWAEMLLKAAESSTSCRAQGMLPGGDFRTVTVWYYQLLEILQRRCHRLRKIGSLGYFEKAKCPRRWRESTSSTCISN